MKTIATSFSSSHFPSSGGRWFAVTTSVMTAAFYLSLPTQIDAQALVLKSGVRVEQDQFSINKDGKIARTVTLSNGQKAQSIISITDIDSLDWPEIKEVLEAESFLSQGKVKEAAASIQKAKEYFTPFKDIKGSPYNELAFRYVEILDQANDFDALLKALPEVAAMKWDAYRTLQLSIINLNMERRRSSDQDKVLEQAKAILATTDDSAVSARIWMAIADIHFRKDRYEEALNAALRVPVFYGTQVTLVPQAELFAARCLVKMERFEDAVGFYQRIGQAYPDSEAAATAKKELLPINGLPNKPDVSPPVTSASS